MSPVAPIFTYVALILANVTSVAGDISPIRLQLGLRRAFFLVVAKVAHIRPAFAFIPANVPTVVINVASVAPNITAIPIISVRRAVASSFPPIRRNTSAPQHHRRKRK